jgi:uncharacterized protein
MSEVRWHERTMLGGVVGSTAYGLAGPDSDEDRLGIYAASFVELASLRPPFGRRDSSLVMNEPDVTQHEALKFAQLALGCNPTVLELLWLERYEVMTHAGGDLVRIRQAFLSQRDVRNSYLGYATQQFNRLEVRGDGSFASTLRKRTAKHARHMLRLLHQGLELYSTGRLTLRLADPERYHSFGTRVASGDLELAKTELRAASDLFDRKRATSPLPQVPDREAVTGWLYRVRLTQALTATRVTA